MSDDDPSAELGGVTWHDIGRILWITASVFGAVVIVVGLWDFMVSKKAFRLRKETLRMALIRPSLHTTWRARLTRFVQPTRSRQGRILELINMIFSVCMLLQYFVRTYSLPRDAGNVVGKVTVCVFNGFFLARYIMRLAIYEPGSRLAYVLSVIPLIDLVTMTSAILPEFAIVASFLTFTYLRIIIVVRNYSNLDLWLTPQSVCNRVTAKLVRIAFMIFAFLLVMGCTVMTLERAGNPDDFGDLVDNPHSYTLWNTIYWSIITVTTVGYGDITPVTALGRMATCVFLVCGVLGASGLFNTILELVTIRKRGMDVYSNWHKKMVVVLCGETNRSQIQDVLAELFPQGQPDIAQHLHVVALLDEGVFKDEDRVFFVGHAFYRLVFSYLRGSLFSWADLLRAGACNPETQAMFILADSSSTDDTSNVLRMTAVRRLLPSLPIYIMLRHSKSMDYAAACNVNPENVVFTDITRFGLITMNAIAPGAATLLLNLLSNATSTAAVQAAVKASQQERNGESTVLEVEKPRMRRVRGFGKPESRPNRHHASALSLWPVYDAIWRVFNGAFGKDAEEGGSTEEESTAKPAPRTMEWEYGSGLSQSIHQFSCPDWLVGLNMQEAALALFCARLVWILPDDPQLKSVLEGGMEDLIIYLHGPNPLGRTQSAILIAVQSASLEDGDDNDGASSYADPSIIMDLGSPYTLQHGDSVFVIVGNFERAPTGKEVAESNLPALLRRALDSHENKHQSSSREKRGDTAISRADSHKQMKRGSAPASESAIRRTRSNITSQPRRPSWPLISRRAQPTQDTSSPHKRQLSTGAAPVNSKPVTTRKWNPALRRKILALAAIAHDLEPSMPVSLVQRGQEPIHPAFQKATNAPLTSLPSATATLPSGRSFRKRKPHIPTFSEPLLPIEHKRTSSGTASHKSCLTREKNDVVYTEAPFAEKCYANHILIISHIGFHGVRNYLLPVLFHAGVKLVVVALKGQDDITASTTYLVRPSSHAAENMPEDVTPTVGTMMVDVIVTDPTHPKVLTRSCASEARRVIILTELCPPRIAEGTYGASGTAPGGGEGELRSRDLSTLNSAPTNVMDQLQLEVAKMDAKAVLTTLLVEHYLRAPSFDVLAGTVTELNNSSSVMLLGHAQSSFARYKMASTSGATPHRDQQESKLDMEPRRSNTMSTLTPTTDEDVHARQRWRLRFGLRWSLRFAAGRIIPTDASNSFICHGYHNPSGLRVVRQLLQGRETQLRHMRIPTDILEAAAGCVAEPEVMPGHTAPVICTFGYIFLQMLIKYKVAVIGLFRHRRWMDAVLPYVQTNPTLDAPVRPGDLLFAILPISAIQGSLKDFVV